MKSYLIYVFSAFVLLGCGTSGPKYSGMWETSLNHGDLVLYRESRFYAVGTVMQVMEKGQQIGTIRNGSYTVISLNQGTHSIHIEPIRPKLFDSVGISKMAVADVNVVINPGEKKFFKLVLTEGIAASGFPLPEMNLSLQSKGQKEAEIELVNLSLNAQ